MQNPLIFWSFTKVAKKYVNFCPIFKRMTEKLLFSGALVPAWLRKLKETYRRALRFKVIFSIYLLCQLKVHIFQESHIFLQNLHCRIVLCSASQIYIGDIAKFCGLLRICELNKTNQRVVCIWKFGLIFTHWWVKSDDF